MRSPDDAQGYEVPGKDNAAHENQERHRTPWSQQKDPPGCHRERTDQEARGQGLKSG